MKKAFLIFLTAIIITGLSACSAREHKARVIVMTDGEIDDHSSMVRFLMYSSDVEVLAIIETNSMFQRNGHSDEDWYEKQLVAYEKVHPNLVKHNPDYPTADELRKVSFIGDEDVTHLEGLREKRWELIPGAGITYRPDHWPDTPGSDRIVEVLLEKNPEPVHIQAWGGGNTAARAFHKLKTEYPEDYQRAVSKVVMYNIWYQDGAGNYIEQEHPEVCMIYCGSFAGTWNYRSQKNTYDFIEYNVKKDHGPLGALYPQDYVSEGDSPAFLYSIGNGRRNHGHPGYGGWGGRFVQTDVYHQVYTDAEDDGDIKKSLRRWVDDSNRDFQARMDWCVAVKFEEANHPPVARVKGSLDREVKTGDKVVLDAGKSSDPDGDELNFRWWQYRDAGNCEGSVEIAFPEKPRTSFTVPEVEEPCTIHIILEVRDNGSPSLVSYRRLIFTLSPS